MKIGKKGGIWDPIKDYIMIIAVAFVLLILVGGIITWIYGRSEEKKCSFSTWAQDLGDKTLIAHWPLDCPAPFQEIKDRGEMKIYGDIATHLKSCWQKMGGGRLSVLGTEFWDDEVKCVVCSQFTLPEDIDWANVATYLESTPAPPSNTHTYAELFQTGWKQFFTVRLGTGGALYDGPPGWQDHLGNLMLYWPDLSTLKKYKNDKQKILVLPAEDDIGEPVEYWVVFWRFADLNTDDWAEKFAKTKERLGEDSNTIREISSSKGDVDFQTMYVIKKSTLKELKCEQTSWTLSSAPPRFV